MISLITTAAIAAALDTAPTCAADSLIATQQLQAATVTASSRARRTAGAENAVRIGQQEMFRAACCNLGESFVTNPSVDVSYDDAATGAAQIKLLGLSGRYVQMLTETMPAFRGAAQPFALGYVPGTWMKAINVSKGASSVKNGYESITGQIDIDYLKPDDERAVDVDLFLDDGLVFQAEAAGNVHINDRLSTNLLLHYQNEWTCADDNGDGFQDMPRVIQYNVSNRWKYVSPRYIMHAGAHIINEERTSRTMEADHISSAAPALIPPAHEDDPFRIGIATKRYEGYMKHAFIVDPDRGGNLALMANVSWHDLAADYGGYRNEFAPSSKHYDVKQSNINAQLMYETQFSDRHALSTGLSVVYDDYSQHLLSHWYSVNAAGVPVSYNGDYRIPLEHETTPGAYAQYTFTLDRTFTLMAGLRYDHSSLYGGFVTPRLHLKWSPREWVTLRASAGKGYRTPHVWAENHNLLASSRVFEVYVPDFSCPPEYLTPPTLYTGKPQQLQLSQEEAWNTGVSAAFTFPVGERVLKFNAEYYYTRFLQQTVIDYDCHSNVIVFHDLHLPDGSYYDRFGVSRPRSFSHVMQVDAQYEFFPGFDVTAAYRHNIVRCSYGFPEFLGEGWDLSLREPILTPRFKALLSLCYQTPLKLWQFDATLSVNGPGRVPDGTYASYYGSGAHTPGTLRSDDTFPAMENLSVQITRRFRYCDVYIGGDNLTNRMQKDAVFHADHPWTAAFEPTLVYGSPAGYMLYAGVRFKL